LGTDPWADDCWDSEPDLGDVPLPISLLNCFSSQATASLDFPVTSSPVLPGVLSHVDKTAWNSWEADFLSPDPNWFSQALELIIQCTVRVGDFSTRASVLIDTGSRIPLLFKKGLVPKDMLERAQRSITIVTADGTPMVGGTHGCKLEVILPVSGRDGSPSGAMNQQFREVI